MDWARRSDGVVVRRRLHRARVAHAALHRRVGRIAENKLRLAEAILTAPDDSCFPDRHRFILDWLCGVFKMKAAAMAPRVDVRFWRLLDMLLHLAVGTSAPDDDVAPPFPLPPLPSALRQRLSQGSRVLLQAAADAFAHESDGACAAALCGRVRRVMRLLLTESWYRPGAEATAEYATSVCASAAQLADAIHAHSESGIGFTSACELSLFATVDALRAVVAPNGGGDIPPKKLLHLFTTTPLLKSVLTLNASCAAHLTSSSTTTSTATTASSSESDSLNGAMKHVVTSIDQCLKDVIVHPDHLTEYSATLHRITAPAVEAPSQSNRSGRAMATGMAATGAMAVAQAVITRRLHLRPSRSLQVRMTSIWALVASLRLRRCVQGNGSRCDATRLCCRYSHFS